MIIGTILVDHGSRVAEANALLLDVVKLYKERTDAAIVEAAHMELAAPTIAEAFAACVAQGAEGVVIHPYFLAPGRHSTQDIPRMTAEAAAGFPGVRFVVTEPLGLDAGMVDLVRRRIEAATGRL